MTEENKESNDKPFIFEDGMIIKFDVEDDGNIKIIVLKDDVVVSEN